MFKKIISATLLVILVTGGTFMMTSCEKQTKEITLSFVSDPISSDNHSTHSYTVEWNDDSFNTAPVEFSPELAKISMVLSAAAYSSDTILNDLKTLGFEKNAKFNYGENYDPTAVGITMASQKIGKTTVLCVVLRGTLGNEWYSNFDIGKDISTAKVHSGFNSATEFALKKLDMYLVNYGIDRDNTKFLVTGHSRGGAVANLLSAQLIDKYGTDNVYAYTFATPNTTTDSSASSKKYSGIFNFVNPMDFIAFVPLSQWGFSKYGTTVMLSVADSEKDDDKLSVVKANFKEYTSREYKSFDSPDRLNSFLDKVYELCPTVQDYYNKQFDIAGNKISMYDYMMTVAKLINEEDVITNGLTMFSTTGTELEELTEYFMSGMDISSDMFSIDYENSLIAYAHTCETYLIWLDIYTASL